MVDRSDWLEVQTYLCVCAGVGCVCVCKTNIKNFLRRCLLVSSDDPVNLRGIFASPEPRHHCTSALYRQPRPLGGGGNRGDDLPDCRRETPLGRVVESSVDTTYAQVFYLHTWLCT